VVHGAEVAHAMATDNAQARVVHGMVGSCPRVVTDVHDQAPEERLNDEGDTLAPDQRRRH